MHRIIFHPVNFLQNFIVGQMFSLFSTKTKRVLTMSLFLICRNHINSADGVETAEQNTQYSFERGSLTFIFSQIYGDVWLLDVMIAVEQYQRNKAGVKVTVLSRCLSFSVTH